MNRQLKVTLCAVLLGVASASAQAQFHGGPFAGNSGWMPMPWGGGNNGWGNNGWGNNWMPWGGNNGWGGPGYNGPGYNRGNYGGNSWMPWSNGNGPGNNGWGNNDGWSSAFGNGFWNNGPFNGMGDTEIEMKMRLRGLMNWRDEGNANYSGNGRGYQGNGYANPWRGQTGGPLPALSAPATR